MVVHCGFSYLFHTMPAIHTVAARSKLTARRDPYYVKLSSGCYLGYRKMTASTGGTWLARMAVDGKQQYKTLGDLAELPDHQRYDAAAKSAAAWFEHLGKGGSTATLKVADACQNYLDAITNPATAKHASQRIKRLVLSQPLAGVDLQKLTPAHFEKWRKATKGIVCDHGPGMGRTRGDASVNRDMTYLRSALNKALKAGHVTSDFAWRNTLAPTPGADGRRDVYLTRQERQKLIDCAQPALSLFIKALCSLPLRPGAVAGLTVGDFDRKQSILTVRKDKAGSGRKIYLPASASSFFIERCKDKLPGAHIFTSSVGSAWRNQTWGYQFRIAAKAAGLADSVTVYALRHSVITDLVQAGVDPVTVGQLAGTSVLMIQRNYSHLTREHAAAALEKLALG